MANKIYGYIRVSSTDQNEECDISSVIIPKSVLGIDYAAFRGQDKLTNVYYAGSESDWANIHIEEDNEYLTSATIHYNSTGPGTGDTGSTGSTGSVRYFNRWDADRQIAYFGSGLVNMELSVGAETDASFASSANGLVGKYVLVEADIDENQSLSGTLINVKPVDSAIGTITEVTNTTKADGTIGTTAITIDGKSYPCAENISIWLLENDTPKALYHIYEGTIVGVTVLTQKTGVFENWDDATKQATISGEILSTNYMTDMSFLALALG